MDEGTATMQAQESEAEQFRKLHTGDDVLILPCAWGVASAKVSEPMRAAMGLTRRIGGKALSMATYRNCPEFAIPYEEVKGMFPAYS